MDKTKPMGEMTLAVGDIIWVKITRGKWWPAEIVDQEKCPEEVTRGLRKQPLAIVKYFDEDYYEIVKSGNHILPFVCPRKSEFIRKGRELLKQDPNAEKFNKDVAEAEKICGVPPEDIYDFCNSYGDNGPPSPYSNHYTLSMAKKNKHNTYGSAMVSTSGPAKPARRLVQSYGGEGDAAYRDRNTTTDDGDSEAGGGGDADVRIRTQPSPAVTPKWAAYSCDVCGFQTGRIANIIVHGRSHSDALRRWVDSGCGARDRPTALFHSDTTGKHRKKSDNHQHTAKVRKLKRKLVTDSSPAQPQLDDGEDKQSRRALAESADEVIEIDGDQAPTPKKRGPKPKLNEDGTPVNKKRGGKPALNDDGTPVVHKKRGPKPALNEDGTPMAKRRKKKEDDADSIFDKIKRQTVRKNSRGRPRGSGGGSSFLGIGGLGHRRRAGSDGSSDEDEFLISRGVYEKEEEEEEAAAAVAATDKQSADEKEKIDEEIAVAEDAPNETDEVVEEPIVEEPMDISEVAEDETKNVVEEVTEQDAPVDKKMETADDEQADTPAQAADDTAEAVPKAISSASGDSPRAAHARDYGSTSAKAAYLTSQQPEDLTSQPEDLTPQREEGAALVASPSEDEVEGHQLRNARVANASSEDDDETAPSAAPKSREESPSPAQDLTTRAEDLTSRPVDLSNMQEEEEPSSGGLPEDASTLLEVSTSLLEDSANLLQSSASLLQDSASLLGGAGPSSSSVGLLLPDSTGNSEDWPTARSTAGKSSVRLWPHHAEEEWGAADDAGQETVSSPRPDSHATTAQRPRTDEVSTSDVLRHLGLVPVVESAPTSRADSEDVAAQSAPHYGRDTPSSSDALLAPTVGTTDQRRSPSGGSAAFHEDPEESTTTTSERVSQTADDLVSQTDADDCVSQTDDERISHAADDDRVSHTDDRISQSDDGNSHQYEDDRISQTDYRISQTTGYDAAHPDYHHHQPAQQLDYQAVSSPYGSELDDRTLRPEQHQDAAAVAVPDSDQLVSQTDAHYHLHEQPNTSAHHQDHQPMSSFDSYGDVSEGLVEEEVVPDVCGEEELVADQSEERVRPSGLHIDDEGGEDLAVDSSVVEEEVVVDQSMIEEECVSQVVECSTDLESCVIVGVDSQSAGRNLSSTSPHDHWSQHVIDENGMVVAAPPDDDIYVDPALARPGHDEYGGYDIYGVPHSTAAATTEGEDHGDHVIEVDVMSSTSSSRRRMDADALSVAMETADVPVAMATEETVGGDHPAMNYGADEEAAAAAAAASMAGHVGLASSDELLASIPMPPPQADAGGQPLYLPLPPDDGDYRPPLPPAAQDDVYQPPLPPTEEAYHLPSPPTDEYPPPSAAYSEEEVPRPLEYTKLEAMVQPADDGDVYLEDVGQEILVESEQVIDEMDMLCGEEVIIDSGDRSHLEYDMCMVQEETVEATEQSFEVEIGGGGEVSKMPAATEEELGVNGGVGLDNGLSFGHAR